MVPDGWTVERIGDTGEVHAGRQRSPHFTTGATRPYLRVANVFDGFIDTSDVNEMAFSDDEFDRYRLNPGDILLNEGQSIGLVGRGAMYLGVPENCCFQNTLIRYQAGARIVPSFALAVFKFFFDTGVFSQVATRTNSIAHLGVSRFADLPMRVPPLPEQQKIAEILGTWDKAIETTEALLANARTQKRALMQSLLTGTRRFPGFEDHPWREVRLQQIADIIVSNVDKKSEPDELPVRLCNYTDVYKNDAIHADMDFMEATATPAQIKKFGLKVGDVIITKDSEDPSDIAVPAYVAETADDLVCGYHLAIIRANHHADGRFLKYCFELPHTRYYFGARANGATRFGLNIDSIETAVFRVPSIAEQRIIADAIQLVEQEIGQTIGMLDHLRTEKKSLMQQLLTGKRRVMV